MMHERWKDGVATAGLFAGALSWFVSTQLNYALLEWTCMRGLFWLVPSLCLLLMLISLAGGFFSWRTWINAAPAPAPDSSTARPRRLLAGVSTLAAALFGLVIALQGTAALVFDGCAR
jgi:hypothetical protein